MKNIFLAGLVSLGCALGSTQALAGMNITNNLPVSITLESTDGDSQVTSLFPSMLSQQGTVFIDIPSTQATVNDEIIYKYVLNNSVGFCTIKLQTAPVGWAVLSNSCTGAAKIVVHPYDMMSGTPATLEITQ